MVLLNLLGKIDYTKDDIVYSINESLRTTRVDELKIPLIIIGDYFAPHWSLKSEEIVDIINTYEQDFTCNRILKSLSYTLYISESEKYKKVSQIYSDYIKFLNFSKEEFTAIRNRFRLIHPSFILPSPNQNIFPYPSIERTIITKKTLADLLLRQEEEILRLKTEKNNATLEVNRINVRDKKPYLLTYNPNKIQNN